MAQEFPRAVAFNLFGQGVAPFQGAQVLVAAGQPVEALPLVRGAGMAREPDARSCTDQDHAGRGQGID
jgi:hypothetical protein